LQYQRLKKFAKSGERIEHMIATEWNVLLPPDQATTCGSKASWSCKSEDGHKIAAGCFQANR
jgi:hypothetical protein